MSEEGYFWREVKEQGKIKRWSNQEQSIKILEKAGIEFECLNAAVAHYRVIGKNDIFNFWPTTGKYYSQKSGVKGRGVFNLIKQLSL